MIVKYWRKCELSACCVVNVARAILWRMYVKLGNASEGLFFLSNERKSEREKESESEWVIDRKRGEWDVIVYTLNVKKKIIFKHPCFHSSLNDEKKTRASLFFTWKKWVIFRRRDFSVDMVILLKVRIFCSLLNDDSFYMHPWL